MAKQRCHTCWNLQTVCPCAQRLIDEALEDTVTPWEWLPQPERNGISNSMSWHTKWKADPGQRWHGGQLRWEWNGTEWRKID